MKFLVLGNNNAITYKEIFPYIKDNQLWLGFSANKTMKFQLSDSYEKWNEMDEQGNKYCKVTAITWFTNIPHNKNQEPLQLTKTYNPIDYPKYDNYDAIEVSKVKDIPIDYDGVMGVPITFLDKYCNSQFEIVCLAAGNSWKNFTEELKKLSFNQNIKYGGGLGCGIVNGKGVYARILIKKNAEFEIVGLGIANLGLEIGVRPYKPHHKQYRKEVQKRGQVDGDLYMVDEQDHPIVPYARILIKRKNKND